MGSGAPEEVNAERASAGSRDPAGRREIARLRREITALERQVHERDLFIEITRSSGALIMACDLGHFVLVINPAMAIEMARRYGVTPTVGDHLIELLEEESEHRGRLRELWASGLEGDETSFVETVDAAGSELRTYEVAFRRLLDEQGGRIGCYQLATDVTERTRAQAQLAEVQDSLRQSQKMEALGQLTGGLVHDFNNLVTGISGSLELLESRIRQGRLAEIGRYVATAQAAAQRAASLTQRLLAFSRRQTLELQPVDMGQLVSGLQDMISRTVAPEITIETTVGPEQWLVLSDKSQLETAVLNLCINARDAMPAGGMLTVTTENLSLGEAEAAELGLPANDYAVLRVADNGTGMSAEVAARAPDPFFTTKPTGKGTGLGLAMVYGFAQQAGGHVRISSALGRGTEISLYLPRHRGEPRLLEGAATEAALPREGHGETMLVVDDDPTVRMLIRDVLLEEGYLSLEAADGASALRMLDQPTRVDLLITDMGLPGGMNGRQLADAARLSRPSLKVLFITDYAESGMPEGDRLAGSMQLLAKPFALEALASKIAELIAG